MAAICPSLLRKLAASVAVTLKTICVAAPPPPAATPRTPSGPRLSGRIASAPASPIRPRSPPIGKKLGLRTTPPSAKGTTDPMKPPIAFPSAPSSGFSAAESAISVSRLPSPRSTSSSPLPPAVAERKAPVSAAPNRCDRASRSAITRESSSASPRVSASEMSSSSMGLPFVTDAWSGCRDVPIQVPVARSGRRSLPAG